MKALEGDDADNEDKYHDDRYHQRFVATMPRSVLGADNERRFFLMLVLMYSCSNKIGVMSNRPMTNLLLYARSSDSSPEDSYQRSHLKMCQRSQECRQNRERWRPSIEKKISPKEQKEGNHSLLQFARDGEDIK